MVSGQVDFVRLQYYYQRYNGNSTYTDSGRYKNVLYDYYSYYTYDSVIDWNVYGPRTGYNTSSSYFDNWKETEGWSSSSSWNWDQTTWPLNDDWGTTTGGYSWSYWSDLTGGASDSGNYDPWQTAPFYPSRYRYAERNTPFNYSDSGTGPWGNDYWNSTSSGTDNIKIRTKLELITGPDLEGWADTYWWLYGWAYDNISMTYIPNGNVTIKGQPLDANGRVLALVPNNSATDVTATASGSIDYDFDVQGVRAETQAGSLIVSIIAPNWSWPGPRPTGMLARLGYNINNTQSPPSDDQILFDVLMNTPLASAAISAINTIFGSDAVDNSAGNLANVTIADRQWLTLGFLARSVNPIPPGAFARSYVDVFAGNIFDYRLLNEFAVKSVVDGNHYRLTRTPYLEKRADIGHTRLTMTGPVNVNLHFGGGWSIVTLSAAQINSVFGLAAGVPNAAAVGHDMVYGGQNGNSTLMHRCAGSAGVILYTVEQAIIRKNPPPFFSEIWFFALNDGIDQRHALSLNHKSWLPGCTWPEGYTYHLDFVNNVYWPYTVDAQSPTPFTCFLTLN